MNSKEQQIKKEKSILAETLGLFSIISLEEFVLWMKILKEDKNIDTGKKFLEELQLIDSLLSILQTGILTNKNKKQIRTLFEERIDFHLNIESTVIVGKALSDRQNLLDQIKPFT